MHRLMTKTFGLKLSCITGCPDEANAGQEKYDPNDAHYSKHGVAAGVVDYPDAGKNEANYAKNSKNCPEGSF
jgi:hypothetical protein